MDLNYAVCKEVSSVIKAISTTRSVSVLQLFVDHHTLGDHHTLLLNTMCKLSESRLALIFFLIGGKDILRRALSKPEYSQHIAYQSDRKARMI